MDGDKKKALRERFDSGELRIGGGQLGGKANGLVFFQAMLSAEFETSRFPDLGIGVPPFAVVGTDVYDEFLDRNGLDEADFEGAADEDIARSFQKGALSEQTIADVSDLLEVTERPLAVRSSSLLEDAIFRPFAGVYGTKMVPNNHPSPTDGLRKVLDAIRLVWATTFFRSARGYLRATGKTARDEKMAVILQEIVGSRHGDRFYPLLSGVGRSFNFYTSGGSKPEEGVVSLALGLGKTIVDGGLAWTFSPARPQAPPPYGSIGDLLDTTQRDFWCVNMAAPDEDNAISETEYLRRLDLSAAEEDGLLRLVASTYDARSERLVIGTSPAGPRVLTFAPILVHREIPLNAIIQDLLAISERAAGAPVEIEFALSPGHESERPSLGFLQVRPMFVSHEMVDIADGDLRGDDLLLASERVMGNGRFQDIREVVFVKPEAFEARHTSAIASEIESLNAGLVKQGRPYLLLGFGRWGSSDPWLGIPVSWSHISGARVIVEATLPSLDVEPSQGAHFFHNVSGNGVGYLCVHHSESPGIDWSWLASQPVTSETTFLRHATLADPLDIRLDGRTGRGIIKRR